jgi:hypothetical protein
MGNTEAPQPQRFAPKIGAALRTFIFSFANCRATIRPWLSIDYWNATTAKTETASRFRNQLIFIIAPSIQYKQESPRPMDTKRLALLLRKQQEIQEQIDSAETDVRRNLDALKTLMHGYNKQSDLLATLSELTKIVENLGYIPSQPREKQVRGGRQTKQRPRVIRPVRQALMQFNNQLGLNELLDLTETYQQRNNMDRSTMIDEINRLVEEGRLLKKGDQYRLPT